MLFTGLVYFRKANIALRSSSVIWRLCCQGMGGKRPLLPSRPLDFPSRTALKNCASVQFPTPLPSELKFAEKETPHGPAAEVRSSLNMISPFLTTLLSYFGSGLSLGNP